MVWCGFEAPDLGSPRALVKSRENTTDLRARSRRRFPRKAAGMRGPAPIAYVVGARPNFVKMAPVIQAMRHLTPARELVVHTGQHYDARLSGDVLADLDFPEPDVSLGVGSGTHGDQTGRVLIAFEQVLLEHSPELVVVAGDVNSTLACALAASKMGIPVAHVESGLRSEDWSMPEEINRVLTDRLSDLLLTHSPEAAENLISEGIDAGRIRFVGNTMIDSLRRLEGKARDRAAWRDLGVTPREYVLVTLHRPVERGRPVPPGRDRRRPHRTGRRHPGGVPHPPADPRPAGRGRRPGAPRGRRRQLHRPGGLRRVPLAAGGRRRDRHRFRRRAGGGGRPRACRATRSAPTRSGP